MKKTSRPLKNIPYDTKSLEKNLGYDYVMLLACRLREISIVKDDGAYGTGVKLAEQSSPCAGVRPVHVTPGSGA